MSKHSRLFVPVPLRRLACVLILLMAVAACFPSGQAILGQLEKAAGLTDFQEVALEWPMSLHVLSVGKADAMLVMVENDAILIDGGTAGNGETVADYLERLGIERLTAVINTHPDTDHYGGLPAVLEKFPCDAFCVSAYSEGEEDAYLSLLQSLEAKDIPLCFWQAGETYSFGQLCVEVLSPSGEYDESNDRSLVLRLTYGERSFLLTGDAQEEAENDMLASGQVLSADVLKVAHHGSRTSTSQAFLEAVSPACAVLSTGEDRNHLPTSEVLQRLEQADVTVLRTDLDGTLVFCTDGNDLKVFAESTETCIFEIQ